MTTYPERRSGRLTGKWITEVTENGERRRKRFDTQSAGQRWEDHIKLTGAPPPEATTDEAAGRTLRSVADEVKATKDTWQNGRDVSVIQRLETAIALIGPNVLIGNVQTTTLDKLVATLRKRPGRDKAKKMDPGTINRYLTAVSTVLTYAQEHVGADGKPYITSKPKIPWQTATKKRRHWLPEDVEAAVCAFMVSQGWEASEVTVRVLAASGLRWGEFEKLEPSVVVFEEAITAWLKLDLTKTNSPRDVPIDVGLAKELVALLASGDRPQYHTFYKHLKAALKSAGHLGSPHALRHTTGTRLMLNDVNLAVAKDFMGHSDIRTTLMYTHVTSRKLLEASKTFTPRAGQAPKEEIRVIEQPTDPKEEMEDNLILFPPVDGRGNR